MEVDYKALQFWLQAVNTIGLFVVGIYSWLSNRHKVNTDAIKNIEESMLKDAKVIEGRFTKIETDMQHLPDDDDLKAIYNRINEVDSSVGNVAGSISNVEGQLTQMNQSLQMITEHLLRG